MIEQCSIDDQLPAALSERHSNRNGLLHHSFLHPFCLLLLCHDSVCIEWDWLNAYGSLSTRSWTSADHQLANPKYTHTQKKKKNEESAFLILLRLDSTTVSTSVQQNSTIYTNGYYTCNRIRRWKGELTLMLFFFFFFFRCL